MVLTAIVISGVRRNGNSASRTGSQVVARILSQGAERCFEVRKLIKTPQVRELIGKLAPEPTDSRLSQSSIERLERLQAQALLVEWHMEKCPTCQNYLNVSSQEREHLDRVLAKHLGTSPPRNKKLALFAP